MVTLFRIEELVSGQIIIDGVDIATLPVQFLRKKLCIIPQDPVMFSASVRFNLDPFNEHSDEDILEVLSGVNMAEYVKSLPGGLSEMVTESGDNFSAGQRQVPPSPPLSLPSLILLCAVDLYWSSVAEKASDPRARRSHGLCGRRDRRSDPKNDPNKVQ
jgi:hypothetical protein